MKSIIKPWRETAGLPPDYPLTCATFVETHMEKEIKELRAALAFVAESDDGDKQGAQSDIGLFNRAGRSPAI